MTHRWTLIGILAGALLLRALPAVIGPNQLDRVSTLDSPLYLDLATNIHEQGSFASTPGPTPVLRIENPWPTEVFRTPGYPLFLAGFFALGVESPRPILAVQILFDLVLVGLAYRVAARLWGETAGCVAAALMAIDVPHVVQSNLIMSDIPFALAVGAVVAMAVLAGTSSRMRDAVAAGLLLLIASAFRPVGFGLSLIVAAFWFNRTRRGMQAAVVLLLGLSFASAWMIRNYRAVGELTPSSAFDFNLYVLSAGRVVARATGAGVNDAASQIAGQVAEDLQARGAGAWRESLRRHGGEALRAHPAATAAVGIRGLAEMLLAGERRHLLRILELEGGRFDVPSLSEGRQGVTSAFDFLRRRPPFESALVLGQLGLNAAVLLLALGGWLAMRDRPLQVFLAVFLLYFMAGSLIVATARMRIPFTIVLSVLAAHGAVAAWRALHGLDRPVLQ